MTEILIKLVDNDLRVIREWIETLELFEKKNNDFLKAKSPELPGLNEKEN